MAFLRSLRHFHRRHRRHRRYHRQRETELRRLRGSREATFSDVLYIGTRLFSVLPGFRAELSTARLAYTYTTLVSFIQNDAYKIRRIDQSREVKRSSYDSLRPLESLRHRNLPMTRPFYPIGNKNVRGEFS